MRKFGASAMNKISGILFDFDGVLSSIIVRLGWPFFHALKKAKPKTTKEEILASLHQIMNLYLKGEKRTIFYVPKMIVKITKVLQLNFFQMLKFMINLGILIRKNNNNIIPEKHADDVLREVTSKYKTGLITHAERSVIQEAFKKFKYLQNIDLIITQQDLQNAKPHPEGLNKAVKFLGLNPEETLYVGDLPHDIQAGKNAGIKTVAVVNFKEAEYGKKFLLQRFKPDYIINHVSELPTLIHNIEHKIKSNVFI